MVSAIRSIAALTRVTVSEAVRDRVLYGLLLFGVGLVLLSAVLSALTLGYRLRIITDISMSGVTFAGVVIAALLGVAAIGREVDRRLVYPILAKPISRTTYVLGKFCGVIATTWLNVAIMLAAATVTIVLYASTEPGGRLFTWGDFALVCLLLLVRVGLVGSVAVALSTFVSSTVALIGTIGVTIAGYLSSDLRYFLGQSDSPVVRTTGEVLYYALPDFSLLDPLGRLIHGQPILTSEVAFGLVYALAYTAVLLIAASAIFSKRDLV